MEELLPLIIGVLWLLYTFYSKGQKKKALRNPSSGVKANEKPSFLEQLLAGEGPSGPDEEDEEFSFESYEEPLPASSAGGRKPPIPFLKSELSEYIEEGQAQFREAFALEQFDHDEGAFQWSEFDSEKEVFDLRKAVVFSAVLDAPYIDYK